MVFEKRGDKNADAILVGYATRSGSTKEVAEAVVKALRDADVPVDLKPLKEVNSLEGYRSVIMGAPLYMFHWHRDALSFLNRSKAALGAVPVAVFALGPFNDKEQEWQDIRKQLTETRQVSLARPGCPDGFWRQVRSRHAPLSHDPATGQ